MCWVGPGNPRVGWDSRVTPKSGVVGYGHACWQSHSLTCTYLPGGPCPGTEPSRWSQVLEPDLSSPQCEHVILCNDPRTPGNELPASEARPVPAQRLSHAPYLVAQLDFPHSSQRPRSHGVQRIHSQPHRAAHGEREVIPRVSCLCCVLPWQFEPQSLWQGKGRRAPHSPSGSPVPSCQPLRPHSKSVGNAGLFR